MYPYVSMCYFCHFREECYQWEEGSGNNVKNFHLYFRPGKSNKENKFLQQTQIFINWFISLLPPIVR